MRNRRRDVVAGRKVALALGALVLFATATVLAGPLEYLFKDERLCDTEGDFCFEGTLSYRSNPRLLQLRARVLKAPGPGLLRIRLSGENELGHSHTAPFEVRVRGSNSEIINHKVIPDYPDVPGWTVDRIDFVPD